MKRPGRPYCGSRGPCCNGKETMGLFSSKSSGTAALTPPMPATSQLIKPSATPTSAPRPVPVASSAPPAQPAPPPPQSERSIYLQQLKVRIHQQLVQRLDVQNLRVLP